MKQILIPLMLGAFAGIIDIIPMLVKKLDVMFTLSAFSMWIAAGLLVSQVRFTSIGFINGIITAMLLFAPLVFLIYRLDRNALPQIFVSTLLLGACLGFAVSLLAV